MRLYTAAASLIGLFLVPFTVSALGLGDISLSSALNEPFSAEIPVESAQQADLDSLTVELASADTFDRYGLDRPAFLGDIRFEVIETANGQAALSLSSDAPVAEPFVTILLDVRWSSGRLLREYTVLLDPPLFEANVVQSAATPAQIAVTTSSPAVGEVTRSPEPVVTEVVEPTGLFQTPPASETAAVIVAVPEPEAVAEVPVEPAPASADVAASADNAPVYNTPFEEPVSPTIPENYTTQRGDTLWRISESVRSGSGLSNNQMMLALYRANPDAFLGNINRLKAGEILRIPDGAELEAPGVSEANSEVVEQHAAWTGAESQESRLQLVAPSGTDDSASAAETDTSVEPAESVADATGGTAGDLDVQADESQRLLQIEDAEMQALQERVGAEEQAAAEADVAGEQAESPAESGEQIFADTETSPESDSLAEDAVDSEASAQPISEEPVVPAPGSVGAAPQEESSFLGGIFTSIWFWASVAIVLLLAMTLGRKGKTEPENAAATGSDWAADIAEPEPELDHDATVKDFGDLESTGSGVAEEADPPVFANDPDAALDEGFEIADEEEIGTENSLLDSADDAVDDPFGDSFAAPEEESEDVLGDDLDFRIDPNDAFAEPESLDDSQDDELVPQEAAGQDEVELPLEKTISTGAPLNLDQADPIAEAEFHMAYGLYDQAADLLVRALEDTPDNKPYRVKLIEVFFVWENKEGFLEQARALRSSVSEDTDSDWNKVLILGKQLCPDDELFSGSDAAAPSADAMDLELSDVGETEIDFTLGGSDVQVLDLDVGLSADDDSGADAGLDFDFDSEPDGANAEGDLTLNLDTDTDTDNIFDSPAADTIALDSADIDLNFGDVDSVDGEATMESPTIENPLVSPDQELTDIDATMESDSLESSMEGETLESPTLDALGATAETTEMRGLEDPTSLEVDLSGLTDLPIESGDLDIPESIDLDLSDASDDAISSDESRDEAGEQDISEEASSPVFGDDDSRMSPETENIRLGDEDATVFASFEELGKVAGDTDQSHAEDEPDSDTVEQPSVEAASGDTAEQPALDLSDTELPADESEVSIPAEDEAWSLPEDATMTEVGTKLDLARAYIDMGDPDGARSILNEVLDEGENTQQQEARQLLAELDD
jgi:pilus assembly protein FimV